MSYNGGIITSAVSIYDVQRALGTNECDLGSLCRHANIKTWAKFRPIEYKPSTSVVLGVLTDAQRASVNYGINNIPIWSGGKTVVNVANYWVNGTTTGNNLPDGYSSPPREGWWVASLPTTAYRLTDFVSGDTPTTRGYFIRADAPIGKLDQCGTENSSSSLVTVMYNMNLDGISSGLTIWYGDLSVMNNVQFKNMYFGIIMVVGSSVYLATQNNTVGDLDVSTSTLWSMGATVRFRFNSSSGAIYNAAVNGTTFKVFPVISSVPNYVGSSAISTSNAAGTFIALQPAEDASIQILFVQGIITSLRAWKTSGQAYTCDFYLSVNDDSTTHYCKITVYFRDKNNTVLATWTNSSQQVTAGASVHITCQQTTTGAKASNVYVVIEKSTTDTSPFWYSNNATAVVEAGPNDPTPDREA